MCKVALLIVVLSMFVPTVVFAEGMPDKEAIQKQVTDQFNQLISAINQKNAGAWSEYYSKDEFLSAIVSTDYYATRSAWVGLITKYFSMRERQHVEPLEVRVTALTSDLALMTSEEKAEMQLKSGENIKSKHVFTMIWKREQAGWKIIHSHESWTEK
jgi:ketosteroid isomerase-like protein